MQLQMAVRFFTNYHKLHETFDEWERKCINTPVPDDEVATEAILKQHITAKEHLTRLAGFTTGEGEEILTKITRQVLNRF
jgi:hypothetical protein